MKVLTHYDDTKKKAHDSQIVRAKENLSYDGSHKNHISLCMLMYAKRPIPS